MLAASPDIRLVGVVTAPPRPAGRGKRVSPSPIELGARDLGVEPILAPARLRAPESIEAVLALEPTLIVLADYGQIVPAALLGLPFGALNLHPSLLPRHRGASPIPATILAGDELTGVTLMRMDAGLDTGPIVAVRDYPLLGDETAPALEAALASLAATLLGETLPAWLRGEIAAAGQPPEGATLTRPLHREDGRLDTARPAAFLERQVRAYQPWPGSWLDTPEGRLSVWRARVGEDRVGSRTGVSGTLAARDAGLALATAAGTLLIDEAQLAGGRRMSVAELLRGHPGLVSR